MVLIFIAHRVYKHFLLSSPCKCKIVNITVLATQQEIYTYLTSLLFLNARMSNNVSNTKFEDTIQCSFFPIKSTQLEDLCESINKTIAALSKDYIWHRDEFKVCVSVFEEEKKGTPDHLISTTCFGDNIEDEWFIVYLVYQITSQYKDVIVQIEDNDGDFLLIEAADFLPAWANPDSTKNKVFIYQGEIHMIPPELVELTLNLDLQDAICLVFKRTDETKASTEIQEAIMKRINSYPQKIRENHHRALVTLPVDIASLLTLKPSLISPIVTSFCNLDTWDTKCLNNVNVEYCVTVPVLFTKYLYAMIMHSNLPKISKFTSSSNKSKDIALGCKLACGYEILMSKICNNIFNSSEFHNFINRLTKIGYFKDNIEGSKDYTELLGKAKDYFSTIECPISTYYGYKISEMMATEEFKNLRNSLTNRVNVNTRHEDVDSDDWLNINPEELLTFLNTNYGKKIVESDTSTANEITTQLGHFLKKTSDFEGIEYVNEDDMDTNIIDFDADQFASCIEKMLSLVSDKENNEDNFGDDFCDEDYAHIEANMDKELASELLNGDMDKSKDDYIVKNLLQSIKEEGISGPSSNVLKNIDVSKVELLDSDDD